MGRARHSIIPSDTHDAWATHKVTSLYGRMVKISDELAHHQQLIYHTIYYNTSILCTVIVDTVTGTLIVDIVAGTLIVDITPGTLIVDIVTGTLIADIVAATLIVDIVAGTLIVNDNIKHQITNDVHTNIVTKVP